MIKFNFDTKTLAREEIAPIYNPYVSLGHIIVHHLKKYPRSVFQVCADDGSEMTCGEIAKLTTNFAKNMLKEGFTEGDVVGIVGRNSHHVTPVIFGCLMIGLPISPVDSKWGNFESVFKVTNPKIIFCGSDIAEKIKLWVEAKEKTIEIVVITEKFEGFKHVSEYLTESKNVNIPLEMKSKASEAVAAMMCTSGTTGADFSKVAKVSHAQLNDSRMLNGDSKDIFGFIFATFSWITGLGLMVFCALNHEKRLYTQLDFTTDLFFDFLDKFKFSHLTGTPTMYQALQQSSRFDSADFDCIKQFLIGGLHCSIEMRQSIMKKMPNAELVIVYGMTENSTNCVTDGSDPFSLSVGQPFSDTQIKILMPGGDFGNLNEIGEILLRRPGKPFLGYVNNETFTKAALDDQGWFHTGDLGFIDDHLNLTIVGRKSFVIHRNSKLLFPSEIEDILIKIPGIKEVCVLGIPRNALKDELPTAFVVKNGKFEVSEDKIHEAISHLDDFKQLSGGVFFFDSFPKSVSGKILRYKVKENCIEVLQKKK